MKIVSAAIIEKSGFYLIARRAPSEKLAGSWEFCGGKVEDGESPKEPGDPDLPHHQDPQGTEGVKLDRERIKIYSSVITIRINAFLGLGPFALK